MVLRNLYFIQQTKSSHVVMLVANWTPWLTGIIYNGFRNLVGSLVLSLGIFVGCRFSEVFNSFSLFLFYGLLSSGRTWSNFLGYYCFSSWGEDDPRFLKYCCIILIFRMTNSHVHNYSYFQLSKLNLNLIKFNLTITNIYSVRFLPKPEQWTALYTCAKDVEFVSFWAFSMRFWN